MLDGTKISTDCDETRRLPTAGSSVISDSVSIIGPTRQDSVHVDISIRPTKAPDWSPQSGRLLKCKYVRDHFFVDVRRMTSFADGTFSVQIDRLSRKTVPFFIR